MILIKWYFAGEKKKENLGKEINYCIVLLYIKWGFFFCGELHEKRGSQL